jgi:hypothetical protein
MLFVGGLFLAAGASLLFMAGPLWLILGANVVTPATAFLIRAHAPWLVAMGVLAVMLRDRDESDPDARAYLIVLLIGSGLGLLMALYAVSAGIVNGLGWLFVIPLLALVAMSGLYLKMG